MTFLVPWAMALGVLGAAGMALLHLVARQRPTAYLLPTARFIPDRQTMVSRAMSHPRDLLLLALRVLLLLCAGAAFAQPVLEGNRGRVGRVILVDQSAAVSDRDAALGLARSLASEPAIVIAFDSAARIVGPTDDGAPLAASHRGGLTTALIAARRHAPSLASRADSIELVLVSPVLHAQLDSATLAVRALWPGGMRIERIPARVDSAPRVALHAAVPPRDALGPALAQLPLEPGPLAVRLRRVAHATRTDSADARAGGVVVTWDSATAPLRADGLAIGDEVIVAPLGRLPLTNAGAVVARWADGAPAARETTLGSGCIRSVGVGVPARGDLALRPAFQRIVRALTGPCAASATLGPLADSATVARLAGAPTLASVGTLLGDTRAPSPVVPWLLGVALACGVAELALRRTARPPANGVA